MMPPNEMISKFYPYIVYSNLQTLLILERKCHLPFQEPGWYEFIRCVASPTASDVNTSFFSFCNILKK